MRNAAEIEIKEELFFVWVSPKSSLPCSQQERGRTPVYQSAPDGVAAKKKKKMKKLEKEDFRELHFDVVAPQGF